MRVRGKSLRPILLRAAVPAAILAAWTVLSETGAVNAYLVPSPRRVLGAAAELARSGELASHAAVSLARVWGGYLIAAGISLPTALAFHFRPALRAAFGGVLEFMRAVPQLALIPLLILWMGIGEASKLAVIVLASFFPIFLNALNGFDSVDGRWKELSRSLELGFGRHLRAILIPGAAGQILTGLRLGFGYAWRALLGAELFSSASGLGYLITDAQEMARVDSVFVGIACIGFLGYACDRLLAAAAKAFGAPESERTWGIDG